LEKEHLRVATRGFFDYTREGFRVADLPNPIKEQIRKRLAEKRVVQHIPARMSGLRVEQNTWRVVGVKDGEALLRQRIRQADGSRPVKETAEKTAKLMGLNGGKLQKLKGALVIPDNYGVALDPQPTVIPFHKVWPRLQELKKANGGKMPRILRNGQLIEVADGTYKGIWKIFSVKNGKKGVTLNLGRPDATDVEYVEIVDGKKIRKTTPGCKRDASLATVLKGGLVMNKYGLTGLPSCPITSST
jgi:hypothetical protein